MKKEKFIEVYDDLLHPTLVNQYEDLLLKNKPNPIPYTYTQNLTGGKNTSYNPGFGYNFLKIQDNLFEPPVFFFTQILYKLSIHLNFNIEAVLVGRTFLQLPTSVSKPGNIHIDYSQPHWVCLYYVNDSDGDTVFFDDVNQEIKRVTPKRGRIAFFDGSISHSSSSPTKIHRSVINYNFIGEYLDKQD